MPSCDRGFAVTIGFKVIDAVMMEAAGIEPASENVPSENLHTCPVPNLSYPRLKEPASQRGHQPIKFRLAWPGQSVEAILPEVTPFN